MKRYKAAVDTERLVSVESFWNNGKKMWVSESGGTWFEAPSPEMLLEQIAEHFGLVARVEEKKPNECGAV